MFAYVENFMKVVQPGFASPSASAGQKTVDRTIHSPLEMAKSTQKPKAIEGE
ncbi:hypothetical protein E4U30_007058, partial [Claviceps sp. LM220 group G6]